MYKMRLYGTTRVLIIMKVCRFLTVDLGPVAVY